MRTKTAESLTIRMLAGTLKALRVVEERTGATPAEQIRRAIKAWLEVQEKEVRRD